jgi:adenosylcobinamide amidohydrolase/ABC-type Fe3+-hydroxamate transport system substrate-binding protein
MKYRRNIFHWLFFGIILAMVLPMSSPAATFPIDVQDATQHTFHFSHKPIRVVSLVPYVTEMLAAFGEEDVIAGLTRQDGCRHSGLRKPYVGSYFHPDTGAIARCRPDLIFAAPSHGDIIRHFSRHRCKVMLMTAGRVEDAFSQMAMIGRLFDCERQAAAVIEHNREQLALVRKRLAHVPVKRRKRVVRVMAGRQPSWPGDDSFQNELITAAGGIAPRPGENGFAVNISLAQWRQFNPQVIYGCHENEDAVLALLDRDGWKDVEAVRKGAVTMFPCDLTCRVSTRTGDFVQWLAAYLYMDTFADPEKAILDNAVLDRRPVALGLDYVARVEVVRHRMADAEYKSLVVRFKAPQDVMSTLEGCLAGVSAVGNTYIPMPASLGHMAYGIVQVKKAIAANLGFAENEFVTLMTGTDMDNLAVQKAAYKDLEVTALVTAGVKGNAMRMSRDTGNYYQPGTINIIVLANRRLSPRAMARAVITVTEAKTAALLDLDIRSSYTPMDLRATGTGTDNVVVVQGQGPTVDMTGGHTKIGELIARAVHGGVTEAVNRQNGLRTDRNLFQRLTDRRLSLEKIVQCYPESISMDRQAVVSRLEKLLTMPYYASFLESALAVSDDHRKGLIKDLVFFDAMCVSVAAKVAGRTDVVLPEISPTNELPLVLAKAFNALITGIAEEDGERKAP